MQPLELPDFDFADDPTVERFLPSFDGRWSQQTKAIQKALGVQRLELNGNWAGVPTDWCCPVCRRYKPEIARLTPAGVVLCQLDRHHDHLADEGARILWRGQQKQPDRARQDALHSAIQVCMALGERFHQTLVCSDCNAADGAATLGHECVHWTGHAARLGRDFSRSTQAYAREELVAELGAAFLCADLGLALEPREDHAAYLDHWLEVLRGDKRFIVSAAAHAQRGVAFLHQASTA